jgi:hypothetical protein
MVDSKNQRENLLMGGLLSRPRDDIEGGVVLIATVKLSSDPAREA